jgi:pimeloyl-ACP methyl ester carboxylesterase
MHQTYALPPCFSLRLRGSEAQSSARKVPHAKIILLHGFKQDHKCWLGTAERLHGKWGHDCLLMDFYGHGQSPYLDHHTDLDIGVLVQQVRDLVVQAEWTDERVVLGGISMGGAVAQHYSIRYPEVIACIGVFVFLLLMPHLLYTRT